MRPPINTGGKYADAREKKMADRLGVLYEYLTPKQCEELKKSVSEKLDTYRWSTYDDHLDEPLDMFPLRNLSNQHLENILITQPQISNEMAAAILMTLKKRWGVE